MQSGKESELTIDISEIVLECARHWRRIGVIAFASAVLSYSVSFLSDPWYTARVVMLPETSEDSRVSLLGGTGLLGGILGSGQSGLTEAYPRLVESARILDDVLAEVWSVEGAEDSLTLLDFLGFQSEEDGELARDRAFTIARSFVRQHVIGFSLDTSSGIMELTVSVPRDRKLAASLANSLAARLEEYADGLRTDRAARRRLFLQDRLGEVRAELFEAEATLSEFVKQNRSYAESPELLQSFNRLEREVEARNLVWVELRQEFERARLEEQKETRSLIVVDPAQAPAFRSKPVRSLYAMVGALLGGLVVAIWISVGVVRRGARSDVPRSAEASPHEMP